MSMLDSFSTQAFTFLLTFNFLGLVVFGIILYFAPQRSVVGAMGWTATDPTKKDYRCKFNLYQI